MVNTKRYSTDSEYQRQILEKAKLKWRDPEFRQKRREYMRAWRLRKREQCYKPIIE